MIDKHTNEQFTVKVEVVIPFEKNLNEIQIDPWQKRKEKRKKKAVISFGKSEDT